MTTFVEYLRAAQGVYACCPNPECASHRALAERILPLANLRVHVDVVSPADRIAELRKAATDELEQRAQSDKQQKQVRLTATNTGRAQGQAALRERVPLYDRIQLRPHEVRLVCHPIDLVAFPGYPNKGHPRAADFESVNSIVLMDRPLSPETPLQQSIRIAVESERYDWMTLWVPPPRRKLQRPPKGVTVLSLGDA